MGNLDPLLAGIKRLANGGSLLAVASPPSIVLNAVSPLAVAYNATSGNYDLTSTGISGWAVNNTGTSTSFQALAGYFLGVNLTPGTVTVTYPPVALGVQWGVKDYKALASLTAYISIPNASNLLEDPNNPGVYTTATINLQIASFSASWISFDGATYSLIG